MCAVCVCVETTTDALLKRFKSFGEHAGGGGGGWKVVGMSVWEGGYLNCI